MCPTTEDSVDVDENGYAPAYKEGSDNYPEAAAVMDSLMPLALLVFRHNVIDWVCDCITGCADLHGVACIQASNHTDWPANAIVGSCKRYPGGRPTFRESCTSSQYRARKDRFASTIAAPLKHYSRLINLIPLATRRTPATARGSLHRIQGNVSWVDADVKKMRPTRFEACKGAPFDTTPYVTASKFKRRGRELAYRGNRRPSDPFAAQFQHDLQPLTEDKSADRTQERPSLHFLDRSSPKP